ncbi:SMC-Scp complex subunit ScpB [Deinococcus wulumuqiensis]|uniref:Segregation and condensation protein B n=1 Tax=Deinococcus wulumuqiensis TaxID=980427 RepID=A0AAV4K4Q7_9DEIO|nr:SMC-Scp complex subunit ScpB [Deinococcus wulumuqiensis]QII19657.1 SMC-Scp complex subunit ScpB [Deinococcus wulumuqiensis R12]GGI70574.1 segregation and condensation protein B [Deinococcus wulumuqiensis]GGP29607.1 segregation and condensation protein B [Deinococcus wulumuqiensis]
MSTDTSPPERAAGSPQALIGAALLAAGRPVRLRELASVLGLGEDAALRAVQAFGAALDAAGLGMALEAVAGGYRLIVPPPLAGHLAPLLAPPPLPTLSSAALEVLAIIAYRQPVTRAEIEAMRGASAGTVLTLQERELVKVVGRSDAVGQPLLYGTTEKFLLEFGLSSLQELPPLQGADFSHLLRS